MTEVNNEPFNLGQGVVTVLGKFWSENKHTMSNDQLISIIDMIASAAIATVAESENKKETI